MHFSLVNRYLVHWVCTVSLLLLVPTSRGLCQSEVQSWIDAAAIWIESYEELAKSAAQAKKSSSEIELEVVLDELDRQREEARIDCLANRLLAEEYQPYDFDIRETMWCKGSLALPAPTLCPTEIVSVAESVAESVAAPEPIDSVVESGWIAAVRSHVWAGFEARLRSHWELVRSHSNSIAANVQVAIAAIDRQRMENSIAKQPSLRSLFGRSVIPYEVGLTSQEYTKLAIDLWRELQANADANGILSHSPWHELKTTNLEPLYSLVTRIPGLFGRNQR